MRGARGSCSVEVRYGGSAVPGAIGIHAPGGRLVHGGGGRSTSEDEDLGRWPRAPIRTRFLPDVIPVTSDAHAGLEGSAGTPLLGVLRRRRPHWAEGGPGPIPRPLALGRTLVGLRADSDDSKRGEAVR